MIIYNKEAPILFTIFNRPDTTKSVFERIRKAQPKRLYIAADGPRNEEEVELCNETRKATELVDWDCSVKKLFQKNNLGCRQSMIKAITWFFENEQEGIILEDDCLPADSFFGFCSTLLEKYRNDECIGLIMGSNFQGGTIRGDGSYYFSALNWTWGWAGWRRVWKDYDPDMKTFPMFEEQKCIDNMSSHKPFKSIWLSNLKDNYIDSDGWDFQFFYLNMINSRLSIVPNKNLISNIGCSNNAFHHTPSHPFRDIEIEELSEIIHPTFLISDTSADMHFQQKHYQLFTSNEESFEGYQFLQNKLSELTTHMSHLQIIPKIIHQFYEDALEPPKILTELSKTWKKYHPNWRYCFWNKESIRKLMEKYCPDLIPIYDEFKYPYQRSDVIRYLILYYIGGLYVDFDYECMESIDSLLINSTCCLGLESISTATRYNKPFIVSNAFMASIPKHPYFKIIIDDVFFNVNKHYEVSIAEHTGPFMLTKLYDSYEKKGDITLIPGDLVTPLTYSEVCLLLKDQEGREIEYKVEKAYAVRYFFNSWWRL